MVKRVLKAVALMPDQAGIGRHGLAPGKRELVVTKSWYLVPYLERGGVIGLLRVILTSRRFRYRW